MPSDGARRVAVENVTPRVDDGRFPVKRILGDVLIVEADVFADGHDELDVRLRWRAENGHGTENGHGPGDDGRGPGIADDGHGTENGHGPGDDGAAPSGGDAAAAWHETAMAPLGNDRWRAQFPLAALGRYRYAIVGRIDRLATWQRDLGRRIDAAQDVAVDLLIGADLVEAVARRAADGTPGGEDAAQLLAQAGFLRSDEPSGPRAERGMDPELLAIAHRHPDDAPSATSGREYAVIVDPERARFSAWYELFPRSASPDPSRHGTFRDVIARLPYVAGLGFDVLYLPPIHPIGLTFRKGPNNRVGAGPDDPGVPWAIGGAEGGHTGLDPQLGSFDDFAALVKAARAAGLEIALDIAFQASPDHPWVKEHPEWFRHRPDGSIQYAENPPKKYQDIYPFDFETPAWRELWGALEGVFRSWLDRGVTIFRVDNPHTKPFAFWEWVIGRIKDDHPEALFLAEAFTRPRVMQRLAKVGFSQSYTYFTWRNTKAELTEYFTELTSAPLVEYFRPNAWPNTPDILHGELQMGGRPMFEARLVLAATLSADYGIYGPAFELTESKPIEPGSEEYLDSEKYQQRTWDLQRADSLAPLITAVNRARRAHPCLQRNEGLAFHPVDNDQLIAYSKRSPDGADLVLCIVNLDPRRRQAGTVELPLEALGLDPAASIEVHDELSGDTYLWQGPRNPVELVPGVRQAHVFAVRQSRRREQQFETYR